MDQAPFVSIVIPCRNEERFVGQCLDSILANDYPRERMEILVVDGMSTDCTREVVAAYVRQHGFIRLLTNPQRITPSAINIGIRHARGDLIMLMCAHATYNERFVSSCVGAFKRYDAHNVGGVTVSVPRDSTKMSDAIVATFNHPFGAGNARYRMRVSKPTWVDTVFGGCYRREVFDKVGLFNENLVRSQDIEFNLRLKKAGGRTLLIPDAVAYYYIRSGVRSFVKHNWLNGIWAVLPFAYSDVIPVSWRHLVPLALASSLVLTALLGVWVAPGCWLFVGITAAYIVAMLAASIHIAWRTRDPWKLLLMPVAFAGLHLAYGFGSLWGVCQTIWLLATGKARRGGPSRVVEAIH